MSEQEDRPITRRTVLKWGVLAAATPLLSQLPVRVLADDRESVVITWNKAALQGVRDSKIGPPMVARALAIVHTCAFDAWAAYDERAVGTRLGAALRRPHQEHTLANQNMAISFAAYRACIDLFPGSRATVFDPLMRSLGYFPNDTTTDVTTPSGVGNVAAQAVIDVRHRDGANQLGDEPGGNGMPYSDYTGYTPVNLPMDLRDYPSCAEPTRPGFDPATVRDPNHWQPLTYRDAALTDEHKMIAEYWADGPHSELPPGHWDLFGQFVSQRDHHGAGKHGVEADAKLFFALTNAVFDAGICCWDNKRFYDSVRPITAIRYLFRGQQIRAWGGPCQGTKWIPGEEWLMYQPSFFPTPPFPSYSSGHSTFSAAGAEILRLFTRSDTFGGSATFAAGSSRTEPGTVPATDVTLRWSTFSAAADQAGVSRRYGGIHFEQDDLDARAAGRLVARQAWAKALSYFNT